MKFSIRPRLSGSLVLFAILFLLTVIFLSLFRDFLTETILIPLMRFFWLIGLVLKSLDQICIWSLAVLVIALFNLIQFLRRTPEAPKGAASLPGAVARARVQFWRKHLRMNARQPAPSRFLSAELRRLVLEVLAFRYHLNPNEVARLVREGQIELPQHVAAAIDISESPLEDSPLMFTVGRRFWRAIWSRIKPVDTQPLARFEGIITYLERILEGSHDTHHF